MSYIVFDKILSDRMKKQCTMIDKLSREHLNWNAKERIIYNPKKSFIKNVGEEIPNDEIGAYEKEYLQNFNLNPYQTEIHQYNKDYYVCNFYIHRFLHHYKLDETKTACFQHCGTCYKVKKYLLEEDFTYKMEFCKLPSHPNGLLCLIRNLNLPGYNKQDVLYNN